MIKNVDVDVKSDGHESDAVDAFLEELRRGPFAPALAGSILDRYGVTSKLTEFLHKNLDAEVMAIFNQARSPVGRPALCLRTQAHNPAYWIGEEGFVGYRLTSLCASAWPGARNLNMSVLDDGDAPQRDEGHMTGADFEKLFPIGKRVIGRIDRRAFGASGWIVTCEVEGRAYRCFLPDAEIDQPVVSLGLTGEFSVISTLPQKRSVLLRFLAAKIAQQTTELGSREDPILLRLKERLFRLKQLHIDGELSDEEFATRRQRIIDEI